MKFHHCKSVIERGKAPKRQSVKKTRFSPIIVHSVKQQNICQKCQLSGKISLSEIAICQLQGLKSFLNYVGIFGKSVFSTFEIILFKFQKTSLCTEFSLFLLCSP